MKINTCKQCLYFIQECDNKAICTINDQYINVNTNQQACEDFTQENNQLDDIDQYVNNNEYYDTLYDEENNNF